MTALSIYSLILLFLFQDAKTRTHIVSDADLTSDIADFPKAIYHSLMGLIAPYLWCLKVVVNILNLHSVENGHCSIRIKSSIAVDKVNQRAKYAVV